MASTPSVDHLTSWLTEQEGSASATFAPDPTDPERVSLTVHQGPITTTAIGDDRNDAARIVLNLLGV